MRKINKVKKQVYLTKAEYLKIKQDIHRRNIEQLNYYFDIAAQAVIDSIKDGYSCTNIYNTKLLEHSDKIKEELNKRFTFLEFDVNETVNHSLRVEWCEKNYE